MGCHDAPEKVKNQQLTAFGAKQTEPKWKQEDRI